MIIKFHIKKIKLENLRLLKLELNRNLKLKLLQLVLTKEINKYDRNICFELKNLTISEDTHTFSRNKHRDLTFSDVFPNLVSFKSIIRKVSYRNTYIIIDISLYIFGNYSYVYSPNFSTINPRCNNVNVKYFLFSFTRNANNKTFEVFPQYIIVFVIAQLSNRIASNISLLV